MATPGSASPAPCFFPGKVSKRKCLTTACRSIKIKQKIQRQKESKARRDPRPKATWADASAVTICLTSASCLALRPPLRSASLAYAARSRAPLLTFTLAYPLASHSNILFSPLQCHICRRLVPTLYSPRLPAEAFPPSKRSLPLPFLHGDLFHNALVAVGSNSSPSQITIHLAAPQDFALS